MERVHENALTGNTSVCGCTREHVHIHMHTILHQTNISLHSQTKWGNRSKLFAYKLMKYYWVKLRWMLITKVMHYLLINGSSLSGQRDGASKWMIGVGHKKKKKGVFKRIEVSRCGGKNALLGSKIWAGGGSEDSWGEERRGKKGVERGGEERIHCWKPNSCVKLSGHGHTPQILVLLEWMKWKCIIHS